MTDSAREQVTTGVRGTTTDLHTARRLLEATEIGTTTDSVQDLAHPGMAEVADIEVQVHSEV